MQIYSNYVRSKKVIILMATLTKSAREHFVVGIFMLVLSTTAVLMRFLSRLGHNQTSLSAAWMCLASLCLLYGWYTLIIN